MTGYKFYLTKSREVADMIRKGIQDELGKGGVVSVGSGCVNEDGRIPAVYHNDGWFYAYIEYGDLDRPKYEITFA